MIILTTPEIYKVRPLKQSSTIEGKYQDYCLAEVPDEFNLTEEEMESNNIAFWYELADGYFDVEKYDYDYYKNRGLVEGVSLTYDISKEKNIALAIYVVCKGIDKEPMNYWEETLPTEDV